MRRNHQCVSLAKSVCAMSLTISLQLGCNSTEHSPLVVAVAGTTQAAGGMTTASGGVSSVGNGGQNSEATFGSAPSTGGTTSASTSNTGGASAFGGSGGATSNPTTTGGTNNGGTNNGGTTVVGLGGVAMTGGRNTGGTTANGTGGTANNTGGVSTSTGGVTVTGAGGSTTNCGLADNTTGERGRRQFLVRDEGLHQIAYLDLANPARNWYTSLASEVASGVQGRDMQLVGNCRVMVGTDLGYEEYDIASGKRLTQLLTYKGTVAAHRLRNKNTMLVGLGTENVPFQGSSGIVLAEVNASGTVVRKTVYPGWSYVRLVRETPAGTYLVTSNTEVFEGNADGTILAQRYSVTGTAANSSGVAATHAWKALRLPNGETLVGTGYGATLSYYTATGSVRRAITGGTDVNPAFYADFQMLSNGNVLVVNWLGHNAGNWSKGLQLLEYTPEGTLAWALSDPTLASKLSSIQAAILLDGLDATKLYVEDTTGQPVKVD